MSADARHNKCSDLPPLNSCQGADSPLYSFCVAVVPLLLWQFGNIESLNQRIKVLQASACQQMPDVDDDKQKYNM